jgi:hypothetical protein
MSDRIRALEDALEQLQSKQSTTPHPLLRRDLLRIKSTFELYGLDAPSQDEDTRREGTKSAASPAKCDEESTTKGGKYFGITALAHVSVCHISTFD